MVINNIHSTISVVRTTFAQSLQKIEHKTESFTGISKFFKKIKNLSFKTKNVSHRKATFQGNPNAWAKFTVRTIANNTTPYDSLFPKDQNGNRFTKLNLETKMRLLSECKHQLDIQNNDILKQLHENLKDEINKQHDYKDWDNIINNLKKINSRKIKEEFQTNLINELRKTPERKEELKDWAKTVVKIIKFSPSNYFLLFPSNPLTNDKQPDKHWSDKVYEEIHKDSNQNSNQAPSPNNNAKDKFAHLTEDATQTLLDEIKNDPHERLQTLKKGLINHMQIMENSKETFFKNFP